MYSGPWSPVISSHRARRSGSGSRPRISRMVEQTASVILTKAPEIRMPLYRTCVPRSPEALHKDDSPSRPASLWPPSQNLRFMMEPWPLLCCQPKPTGRADFLDATNALSADVVVGSDRRLAISERCKRRRSSSMSRPRKSPQRRSPPTRRSHRSTAVVAADDQGVVVANAGRRAPRASP